MHQGNPDMSTNFAASTHEFPDVDVVPVTELERIPKRNWDFCPMARSPMARPSLLLSAKRMHIAPSCEIVNRPCTLCRMRPQDSQYVGEFTAQPPAGKPTVRQFCQMFGPASQWSGWKCMGLPGIATQITIMATGGSPCAVVLMALGCRSISGQ